MDYLYLSTKTKYDINYNSNKRLVSKLDIYIDYYSKHPSKCLNYAETMGEKRSWRLTGHVVVFQPVNVEDF